MAHGVFLADTAAVRGLSTPWMGALTIALIFVVLGLVGILSLAWGYALFTAAEILLTGGVVAFGLFALRQRERSLFEPARVALILGGVAYLWAVSALSGTYTHLAARGEIEWEWILFGPCILVALIVLDVGLYRRLIRNNLPTWHRFGSYVSHDRADPANLRRTLIDEVILHRSLYRASKVRWLRHTLIFWGFSAMFAVELVAVVVRDGFPAFGWPDIWREHHHPVSIAFAVVYDFTGLMILVGCLIALAWRVSVNNSPERRYGDTPTTLFLLLVVVTGFILEGLRMLPMIEQPWHWLLPGGMAAAHVLVSMGVQEGPIQGVWVVHVLASCAFIAYVPVKRLVHSCATPIGRLMNSQKQMLAAKKRGVLAGLMGGVASSGASRNH